MQVKYYGLGAVVIAVAAIIAYKNYLPKTPQAADQVQIPRVLLVANLAEANEKDDACAQIIQLVRAARQRGLAVQELDSSSKSPLISKYHVLTIPTVVFFDRNGTETARFEGEDGSVVQNVRTHLAQMK